MNKQIITFLKSYSFKPDDIDRLIVSAFLYSINLTHTKNNLLKNYLIRESDKDYQWLLELLQINSFNTIEQVIEAFEFVISPEDKIVNGAVYTPNIIRDYIVDQTLKGVSDFTKIKVCDPACGCAGFLYTTAKKIKLNTFLRYEDIFREVIYGLDIQNYSVIRSKLLLTLLAVSEGEDCEEFVFNIFKGNALNFDWSTMLDQFSGFDIIVGNPPYVCSRNIDDESKSLLSDWSVCKSGHPDLYIPFFELGLEILKENGVLGYITMNTFFKSLNGRALREYFKGKSYSFRIIDFGSQQIFQSRSTYTCICLIQKKYSEYIYYLKSGGADELEDHLVFTPVPYSKLDSINGWNLQNISILNKIEETGTPFSRRFRSRNGIATLKNEVYIFSPVNEDENFYYIERGEIYPIEKDICKDIINPNKLNKIDSIEKIKDKVIFPYRQENGQVKLILEDEFSTLYPNTYNYLKANSQLLATRDKGKGSYEAWYAYGRNQSLERYSYKLFFPHISPSSPNFVFSSDENLLFYNGLAIIGNNERELLFLKKLMGSRLFWFYISNSSKPYGSKYFSLSKTYFKNFGVPDFTEDEIDFIINEDNKNRLDKFIELIYNVELSEYGSPELLHNQNLVILSE